LARLSAALADRYRIERELGAGGMATVYLAHDLKHEREVAIKVLKPELAAVLGADRFIVEIKTTAALQHPHILPLFDSGSADGFLFYVMPYVRGETLRTKLDRETQLGIDEAVRITRDVADALDYAHRHGVIHRDIKPENILLHDGRPMVADFGIALALSAAAGGRMTETGMSLGTPHYMSPEQATADKEISGRSDIYSLGSVLYEMLTGNPPHTGSSAQQIIMKIIAEPIEPVTKYRKSVPPNVAAATAKALEKLPADRFESARAFGEALANPAFTTIYGGGRGRAHTGNPRRVWWAAASIAAIAFATTGWAMLRPAREATATVIRFRLTGGADLRVADGRPAISRDGRTLVFRGVRGGISMLFWRALDDSVVHAIPGTENASLPFLSPDGKWIAFFSLVGLQKMQFSGGAATVVSTSVAARGGAWTNGDVILIGMPGQMLEIPAGGGTPRPVAPLDTAHGETSQSFPLPLADGETVVYTSGRTGIGGSQIGVLSLSKGTTQLLDLPGTTALAVLDDHLIYVSSTGSLMAVPFDSRHARVTGAPVTVATGVAVPGSGNAYAAISPSGSLVYQAGAATSQIMLVDLQGVGKILVPDSKAFSHPRFSPDGKRLAIDVATAASTDIWIYDIGSGTSTRLTSEGDNARPEWTPDGKQVLYMATNHAEQKGRGAELWWQPSDGSGAAKVLQSHPKSSVNEGVFTADGHILAYRISGGGAYEDLWYRQLEGDTASKPIVTTKFTEWAPRFSPDGRWVAYTSDQSGTTEVYVQAFPALGARYPVSIGGGRTPIWAPDGRHVYYVANGQLSVATIATTPTFAVVARQPLIEGSYDLSVGARANFDVAPDGQHLVLLKATNAEAPLLVVHNWRAELTERLAQMAKK
jgi:eukaryotic-like serine/threonine-protein kinase